VLGGVEREIVGGSHAGGGRHPAQGFCDSWWPTLHVGVTAGTVTGYQEEGRRIGTSWKATLPVIGRRRMASVTGDDFTVIYSDMLQPGLAGRSAGHVHRVALRMFRDVKTQGVVSSNPLEDAQKPAEDKYTFST
jgi:hypothetical protein